jgi:hypothetical protein
MRPRQRELAIFVGFLLAAIVLTWPLVPTFFTRIGGDDGSDHWQTLWGMWWFRKALLTLHVNPFFSHDVHWPMGMSMVFETFDIPDCLLALPLWSFLPPIAVFNCVELWSYPLAGYFFYRFALELLEWEAVPASTAVKRTAAIAAGALFTFCPYHFGHSRGHMHLVAMQWVPLYFWMLIRTLSRPERRWPLFAALALAAASTASWYQLLFCVILTFPFLVYVAAFHAETRTWQTLRRALTLGAAYLVILWPLFSAMLAAKASTAWDGAHNPNVFSADWQEFFFPNESQSLGHTLSIPWGHWSGNFGENSDYLGFAALALALVGAIRRRGARYWLFAVGLGVVLAMGPHLHVGGHVDTSTTLPYGWLTSAVPLLEFMGVPVRIGFVALFGLMTAAAFGLAELLSSRKGAWIAVALLLAGAFEYWPRQFITRTFPQPEIFKRWAADPSEFAVDDRSGDVRPLFNAVLHNHPTVDVYLSRTPVPLQQWLDNHPVFSRLRHATPGPFPLTRDQGLQLLRDERIRYFVVPAYARPAVLERDLQLPTIYLGDGLRIYEVPDWPSGPST